MKILQSISILCVLLMSTVYVDPARFGRGHIRIIDSTAGIQAANKKITDLIKKNNFEEAKKWITELEQTKTGKEKASPLRQKLTDAQTASQKITIKDTLFGKREASSIIKKLIAQDHFEEAKRWIAELENKHGGKEDAESLKSALTAAKKALDEKTKKSIATLTHIEADQKITIQDTLSERQKANSIIKKLMTKKHFKEAQEWITALEKTKNGKKEADSLQSKLTAAEEALKLKTEKSIAKLTSVDAARAGQKITIKNTPKGLRAASKTIEELMKENRFEEAQRWITVLEKKQKGKKKAENLKSKLAQERLTAANLEGTFAQEQLTAEAIVRANQALQDLREKAQADLQQEKANSQTALRASQTALQTSQATLQALQTQWDATKKELSDVKIKLQTAKDNVPIAVATHKRELNELEEELGALALWRMDLLVFDSEDLDRNNITSLMEKMPTEQNYKIFLKKWKDVYKKDPSRYKLRHKKP